ncbi:MAG: hypothetical protein WAO19_10390, partial [Candidatus Kryptoniota bacterium]
KKANVNETDHVPSCKGLGSSQPTKDGCETSVREMQVFAKILAVRFAFGSDCNCMMFLCFVFCQSNCNRSKLPQLKRVLDNCPSVNCTASEVPE